MHLQLIVVIMILAGIFSPTVNYYLPNKEIDGVNIRRDLAYIILGIGATLIAPLFLEITKSSITQYIIHANPKILESINKHPFSIKQTYILKSTSDRFVIQTPEKTDIPTIPSYKTTLESAILKSNILKNYLLFIAYCNVAAAGEFRFMNSIIKFVVKVQENVQQKSENKEHKKNKEKPVAQNQLNHIEKEIALNAKIVESTTNKSIIPINENINHESVSLSKTIAPLPPNMHPNDPLKEHFGGKSENSNRRLSVKVNPIGVITDNGKTLLELDLCRNNLFPEEFRNRKHV